jgi:hypothetical protein
MSFCFEGVIGIFVRNALVRVRPWLHARRWLAMPYNEVLMGQQWCYGPLRPRPRLHRDGPPVSQGCSVRRPGLHRSTAARVNQVARARPLDGFTVRGAVQRAEPWTDGEEPTGPETAPTGARDELYGVTQL